MRILSGNFLRANQEIYAFKSYSFLDSNLAHSHIDSNVTTSSAAQPALSDFFKVYCDHRMDSKVVIAR